jgi:hypothetical protein
VHPLRVAKEIQFNTPKHPRKMDRAEAMRIAAEKMRLKREREAQEEKAIYERITSGTPWMLFKMVVAFCTLLCVLTTFEYFVDGPTKKISEYNCKIDRDWEWESHRVLDVEGYMFAPEIGDWFNRRKNNISLTYSPIFRTGKKLNFMVNVGDTFVRRQEEIRQRSVYEWFPIFQIFLLIPLATFLFKRQKPWFNFARLASFYFVLPGSLIALFYGIF